MNINELRQKSQDELNKHLLELRREQFNLRMQRGAGELEKTHQFRNVRREVARVKMLLGATRNDEK